MEKSFRGFHFVEIIPINSKMKNVKNRIKPEDIVPRKITFFFLFISLNFVMLNFVYSQQKSGIVIQSISNISININPGSEYYYSVLLFFNRPPTIACWLESVDGEYVETIFVTHNAKTGEWYGHPQGQPGALPVWTNKVSDKKIDAISGSSLGKGKKFIANAGKPLASGSYIIKFEINKPYDYNKIFRKNLPKNDPKYSGDNGQPSLIYEGKLEIGKNSNTSFLKPVGTGSPNGQDGQIHDLTGLSSALKIIDSVEVIFSP